MALLEDRNKMKSIYAPGTPTVNAQNKQTEVIGAVAQGAANLADKYAGGQGARQLGRAAATPFQAVASDRDRQKDMMAGYPKRDSRLQAAGGQLQADIASGDFPKQKQFNPITRPSYVTTPANNVAARETLLGNPAANGIGSPAVSKGVNSVSMRQADGGRGSISLMPGHENKVWGVEQGNGTRPPTTGIARQAMGVPVAQRTERSAPQAGVRPRLDGIKSYDEFLARGLLLGQEKQAAETADISNKNSIAMRGQDLTEASALRRDNLTEANQDAQNGLARDTFNQGATGIGIDNQTKQLDLEQSQEVKALMGQLANATDEPARAEATRKLKAYGVMKEDPSSKFSTLDQYDDQGTKVGQVLYDQTTGKIMGGGQQGITPESIIMGNPEYLKKWQSSNPEEQKAMMEKLKSRLNGTQ